AHLLPRNSTLFPYTTLFRSHGICRGAGHRRRAAAGDARGRTPGTTGARPELHPADRHGAQRDQSVRARSCLHRDRVERMMTAQAYGVTDVTVGAAVAPARLRDLPPTHFRSSEQSTP